MKIEKQWHTTLQLKFFPSVLEFNSKEIMLRMALIFGDNGMKIASDILSQSGFDWDSTKYIINVENENAWNEYVKVIIFLMLITIQLNLFCIIIIINIFSFVFMSHDEAKRFRFKVSPNWDDNVDLCAKDKATGIGSENVLDIDDLMSKEANKEEGAHSVSIDLEEISTTKKKTCKSRNGEKEGIVASMSEVASSLKVFAEVVL